MGFFHLPLGQQSQYFRKIDPSRLIVQVAVIAVYVYFFATLFGRQYLIPRGAYLDNTTFPHLNVTYSSRFPYVRHSPDFVVPWFTILEFFCYMGWIKVGIVT